MNLSLLYSFDKTSAKVKGRGVRQTMLRLLFLSLFHVSLTCSVFCQQSLPFPSFRLCALWARCFRYQSCFLPLPTVLCLSPFTTHTHSLSLSTAAYLHLSPVILRHHALSLSLSLSQSLSLLLGKCTRVTKLNVVDKGWANFSVRGSH